MHRPASHPHETRRLRALRALNVLDTPIEERFERITRSARLMLRMPVAAVSLVDEHRQWFKSIRGLEIEETPREVSFCGHALLGDGPLVVRDATLDDRFADNPLVQEAPWIRFYAGYPVRAPNGLPVGTLCVVDRKPRRFGRKALTILRSLARTAEAELRTRMPGEAQRSLVEDLGPDRGEALDGPTRLWSREAILEILERKLRRARSRSEALGVLVVDLAPPAQDPAETDIADALLRGAARRVLRAMRPQDATGRFGSNEFLAVAEGLSRADLGVAAHRIRAKLSRSPVPTPRGRLALEAGVGAAWAPARELRTSGALLDAANCALCSAHQRGGSRVEVRGL